MCYALFGVCKDKYISNLNKFLRTPPKKWNKEDTHRVNAMRKEAKWFSFVCVRVAIIVICRSPQTSCPQTSNNNFKCQFSRFLDPLTFCVYIFYIFEHLYILIIDKWVVFIINYFKIIFFRDTNREEEKKLLSEIK
jgi:hypothetical protein